ncbi:MAG TPA: hypothetical protein VG223_11810 [Solirubrobacteraceae bacterium]|jgi:hypothetical protein|nr:hypothetical protein [Solirubrobacteraceae bacterium]
MTLRALVPLLASVGHTRHSTPTGWFLLVLVLLVLLYFLWRSGRLRTLFAALGARRMAGTRRGLLPAGVQIRPIALLPMALLLIVVAVLVISH